MFSVDDDDGCREMYKNKSSWNEDEEDPRVTGYFCFTLYMYNMYSMIGTYVYIVYYRVYYNNMYWLPPHRLPTEHAGTRATN